MKPILFATPRTGSTVIALQLDKIATDLWQGIGYIGEVFSLWTDNPNELVEELNCLRLVYGVDFDTRKEDWRLEVILRRIELLKKYPGHLIKLLADQYHPVMDSWIENDRNVIFLERKNKLDQLLSLMAMHTTKRPHYLKTDTDTVEEIVYYPELVESLIYQFEYYAQVKSMFKGPVIYYEDWYSAGADEIALSKILGIDYNQEQSVNIKFQETPYADNPENLIVNKDQWLADKPQILEQLKKYETHSICNTEIW